MTTPIPPAMLEVATKAITRYVANLESCSIQLSEFYYPEVAERVLIAVNIAHLQAAADALPGLVAALEDVLPLIEEFQSFCDSPERGCAEYGAECPISMGEWVKADEREKVSKARAALTAAKGGAQ